MKSDFYNIDYFLNTGCEKYQSIWALYPKGVDNKKLSYLLTIMEDTLTKKGYIFLNQSRRLHDELCKNKDYPDPLRNKVFSSWFYVTLDNSSVIYRFSSDGRVDEGNRIIPTIEGIYIKDIDIEKTVKKYQNVDIIELLGKHIPRDMERILVEKNADSFKNMYNDHKKNGKLEMLFNHFYEQLAFGYNCRLYTVSDVVEFPLLYKISPFKNLLR